MTRGHQPTRNSARNHARRRDASAPLTTRHLDRRAQVLLAAYGAAGRECADADTEHVDLPSGTRVAVRCQYRLCSGTRQDLESHLAKMMVGSQRLFEP